MTRTEIAAFVARRMETWKGHDPEKMAADHADDCVLESPVGGTVRGRDAIRSIYAGWIAAFPDVQFRQERRVIDGNQAVLFTRMIGTHSGEFCGLPPSGKHFEVNCIFWLVLAEGKIAHEIRVYDFAGLLLQLGVLKAKLTA